MALKRGAYQAYEYIEHSQIKPYWTMAQRYVLADEMFPTEFGGSFTGHLTLVAGNDNIELPKAEVDFPRRVPDDCDSPPGTRVHGRPESRRNLQRPIPLLHQFNTMAQASRAGSFVEYYATKF